MNDKKSNRKSSTVEKPRMPVVHEVTTTEDFNGLKLQERDTVKVTGGKVKDFRSNRDFSVTVTGSAYFSTAWGYTIAEQNAHIFADGGTLALKGNAVALVNKNTTVIARGKSFVRAHGACIVTAEDSATVEAFDDTIVHVSDFNPDVKVILHDRARAKVGYKRTYPVQAGDFSSVTISYGSRPSLVRKQVVIASGNASVYPRADTLKPYKFEFPEKCGIILQGNARCIPSIPTSLKEMIDYYGLKTDGKGNVILYKAVHDDLSAFYNPSFKYAVGESSKQKLDSRPIQCGAGLHVSDLEYAFSFGLEHRSPFKILECLVPIDKILFPNDFSGKVRTSELTVLRVLSVEDLPVIARFYTTHRPDTFKSISW